MKIFFMAFTLLISSSIFAAKVLETTPQTQVLPTAAPGASSEGLKETQPETKAPVAQKQETKPGIDNPYPIGDYDQKGEYNYFDRLEQEKRAAQEEKDEQGN